MDNWTDDNLSVEQNTTVSVIVPVYNAETFLDQCLESILQQTLADFELICIDDGSTDSSLAILNKYATSDQRIQILTQKNSGAGVARNLGLSQAKGDYLSFLDADDYFEPDMLEVMVTSAKANDAQVVVCRASTFGGQDGAILPKTDSVRDLVENRVYSSEDLQDKLFNYFVGWAWDKLFQKSFILEHGLQFQQLSSTNDALFVYLAMALAKRITIVDKYLAYHRIGNAGSIENNRQKSWDNAFCAIDAIEQRLKQEGLYQQFEPSFLGWIFDFCMWNFETLQGQAKSSFLVKMTEEMLPRINFIDLDELHCDYPTDYLPIFRLSHIDLLNKQIESYWDIKWLTEEGQNLRTEIQRLNVEADALRTQISYLEADLQNLEQSTAYKVGRAVTFVPRVVKDRFSPGTDSSSSSGPGMGTSAE